MDAQVGPLRPFEHDFLTLPEGRAKVLLGVADIGLEFADVAGQPDRWSERRLAAAPDNLAGSGRPHPLFRRGDGIEQLGFERTVLFLDHHRLPVDYEMAFIFEPWMIVDLFENRLERNGRTRSNQNLGFLVRAGAAGSWI